MSILPSIVKSAPNNKSGDADIFIPLVQKLESKTPRHNNQVCNIVQFSGLLFHSYAIYCIVNYNFINIINAIF